MCAPSSRLPSCSLGGGHSMLTGPPVNPLWLVLDSVAGAFFTIVDLLMVGV